MNCNFELFVAKGHQPVTHEGCRLTYVNLEGVERIITVDVIVHSQGDIIIDVSKAAQAEIDEFMKVVNKVSNETTPSYYWRISQ